jgi:hypothetical protein
VPREVAAQLAAQMKRPEGTVSWTGTFPRLHDPSVESGILAEVVSGAHIFRIAREGPPLTLSAYHSSPGTGTRVASIDLAGLAPAESLGFVIAWSPEVLRFALFDCSNRDRLVQAEGRAAEISLWRDDSGGVVEVGSPGVKVMGATVYTGGTRLVSPPAIELWRETTQAVRFLMSGESSEGYIFEVVVANAVIGMLVTGFEVYCQERFREIDDEGIPANSRALLERFGTSEERAQLRAGVTPALIEDIETRGNSAAEALASRIGFQNYDHSTRAFNKG